MHAYCSNCLWSVFEQCHQILFAGPTWAVDGRRGISLGSLMCFLGAWAQLVLGLFPLWPCWFPGCCIPSCRPLLLLCVCSFQSCVAVVDEAEQACSGEQASTHIVFIGPRGLEQITLALCMCRHLDSLIRGVSAYTLNGRVCFWSDSDCGVLT